MSLFKINKLMYKLNCKLSITSYFNLVEHFLSFSFEELILLRI
jgi:hypothetical protein